MNYPDIIKKLEDKALDPKKAAEYRGFLAKALAK